MCPVGGALGLLLTNKIDEHAHLKDASIGYVFRDDEFRRRGKVTAAETILTEWHGPGAKLAWFFVAQEILFFGVIFMAYFIFREMYPDAWGRLASSELEDRLPTPSC